MAHAAAAENPGIGVGRVDVMTRLKAVCDDRGSARVAAKLADLVALVQDDLVLVEKALEDFPKQERDVAKAGLHILELGGKRLRPTCVVLAAALGDGFSPAVRDLASAVELVHCATLLHDDVVDIGDTRRGVPAARTIYGNAASIFAGDWLLVEALRRVRRSQTPLVLDRLLDIIDEMIMAESLQLEARGDLIPDRNRYFAVVEGKTAALFRWAMFAGALGGRLSADDAAGLERYGLHLGIAFQIIDDLLDFIGDGKGKELFADLREGKITYPLIITAEQNESATALIERAADRDQAAIDELLTLMHEIGAFDSTRELAAKHIDLACAELDKLDAETVSPRAKEALLTVAEATLKRSF